MSRSLPPVALSKLTVLCRSGIDQDEETLRNQIREREAAKRQEEEAREREAELARQRLEEERLAREQEERRQTEREKAPEKKKGVGRGVSRTAGPSSSGVRGVRGTRASIRARGVAAGIARGRTDSFFNIRDGAHALKRCVKAQPPLRVPERRASLDPHPRHQPGRA